MGDELVQNVEGTAGTGGGGVDHYYTPITRKHITTQFLVK